MEPTPLAVAHVTVLVCLSLLGAAVPVGMTVWLITERQEAAGFERLLPIQGRWLRYLLAIVVLPLTIAAPVGLTSLVLYLGHWFGTITGAALVAVVVYVLWPRRRS